MNPDPRESRLDAAETFARCLRTAEKSSGDALRQRLAPDVVYSINGVETRGAGPVVDRLAKQWPFTPVMARGSWSPAVTEGDRVRIAASFDTLGAAPRNYALVFDFDASDRLVRIAESFEFPTKAVKSTRIPAPVRSAIDRALANGTPMVLAYVDDDGAPALSLRGSVQVWSERELCAWVRNATSGLVRAVGAGRPLALLYRDSTTRTTLVIKGRGTIASDEAIRDRVFRQVPEVEQTHDPERRGAALIIEIERIAGTHPNGPVLVEP